MAQAKSHWTKPFSWSDDAPDRNFSVPGGQVYGVTTTDFFCTAAEKGSFTLLRLTANPTPVLIAGSRPRTFGSTVA